MSLNSIPGGISTQEQRSNGGKNRARNLTPERRKEIATKASYSRKCMKGIPKATHYGKLNIGGIEITCAVLEDGRSVITERSLFSLVGMKSGGKKAGGSAKNGQIPRFLMTNNLQVYVERCLGGSRELFSIVTPHGGKANAYEADMLPKVLKVFMEARRGGVLTESQMAVAATAEIISIALAQTGLVALIHECTGFQKDREKDALQSLFSKFIATELQPWIKRFPDQFFSNLKRIYGLDDMKGRPSFFGHLINKWIYKELSPEVHEELKRINPITESGCRKHAHHRLLTPEIGCPALEKQIAKVNTILSLSDSKEEVDNLIEKSKR